MAQLPKKLFEALFDFFSILKKIVPDLFLNYSNFLNERGRRELRDSELRQLLAKFEGALAQDSKAWHNFQKTI